jgi:hypothetical protein
MGQEKYMTDNIVITEVLGTEIEEDFLTPDSTPTPKITRVAFDTETDLIGPGNVAPKLICITIAARDAEGNIQTDIRGNGDEDQEAFITELLVDPNVFLIGHHTCFDLAVIARAFPKTIPLIFAALEGTRISDTKIREQLLRISGHGKIAFEVMPDGSTKKSQYSLADLVKRHLQVDRSALKEGTDIWRLNYRQLDGFKAEDYPAEARTYALGDASDTLEVSEAQDRLVENYELVGPMSTRTEDFQTAVSFALYLTTCSGIHVDPVMRDKIAALIESELTPEHLTLLIEHGILRPPEAPRPFKNGTKMTQGKPSSINEKALHAWVVEACSRQGVKLRTTEKDAVSTEADFLEDLREADPVIDQYLHRQEQQKVVQALRSIGDATVVYPGFNVLVESGRTSSYGNAKGKPALYPSLQAQNVDPRVRPMFVAPPGWCLVSCDYSSLELVSLAQKLLNLFGRSTLAGQLLAGIDPHAFLGSVIAYRLDEKFRASCVAGELESKDDIYKAFIAMKSNKDLEPVYNQWRTLAKPVGLGFPGGLGPRTLCAVAKKQYGLQVSEDLATTLREIWRDTYPEMPEYFNWITTRCVDQRDPDKFAYVTPLGMYRAGCTYCAASNGAALQSPSAEGAKLAHFNVVRAMFDESLGLPLLGCKPLAFVHDEILCRMPIDEHLTERALLVSTIMVESLSMVMPDLKSAIKAAPAAMLRWDKRAKSVFDSAGKLQIWTPPQEA